MAENGIGLDGVGVGVIGSRGRMGCALLVALPEHRGLRLGGALDQGDGDLSDLVQVSDVLIDFTDPQALIPHVGAARAARRPILVGTTGLNARHHAAIDAAAADIAILQTANASLGLTLLLGLVSQAAARLDWDVEIAELHHRDKLDAPSGTALALGDAVARARGKALGELRAATRDGRRQPGSIGFASMRGGTAPGDHRVHFFGQGERLEFSHIAEDRAVFAHGALTAAAWLARQPAGRYTMADVLGL